MNTKGCNLMLKELLKGEALNSPSHAGSHSVIVLQSYFRTVKIKHLISNMI